jgi:hypothetical protein
MLVKPEERLSGGLDIAKLFSEKPLNPTSEGRKFTKSTKQASRIFQFFIKQVAYQQNPKDTGGSIKNAHLVDALADGESCKRDIPCLKQLGANLVSVCATDPAQDHSKCKSQLDASGIYVLSELANNKTSISSETPDCDFQLYQQYTSVIDTLQRYSNIVGFSVGNEVIQSAESTKDVAFSKLQSAIPRRTSRPKDSVPPWKSATRTKALMKL